MGRLRESEGRNASQLNADNGNDRAFAEVRGLALAWGRGCQNANSPAGDGAFVRVKNADSVYAILHLFHPTGYPNSKEIV
jgi:hypothetical protein